MYNTNRDGISRLKTNAKIPSKIYMIEGEDFTSSPKISNFYEIELYESIQEAITSGLIIIPSSGSGISSDADNELTLGSDNLPYYNLDFTEGSIIFADSNGDLTEDNLNFFYDQPFDYLKLGSDANTPMSNQVAGSHRGMAITNPEGTACLELTSHRSVNFNGSKIRTARAWGTADSLVALPTLNAADVYRTTPNSGVGRLMAEFNGGYMHGTSGLTTDWQSEATSLNFYIQEAAAGASGRVRTGISLSVTDTTRASYSGVGAAGIHAFFRPTGWKWENYLSTRDDSGVTTPANFLYTSPTGEVLSAPSGELTVNNPVSATTTSIDIALSDLKDKTFDELVIVKESSDFGTIDSSKIYFIDGIIDMGTTSIEIPSGGINIAGHDFNVSKLISSDPNFTLFTSPVGGSGDVFIKNMSFEITGSNSQLFDLTADNGFEAVEMRSVNFNNCTSLGELTGYRQALELNTGRFGGTPSLTLSGTWSGGYFIETSIARSLTDGAYALYQEGISFTMASRFKSNQNLDLNSTVAFMDFVPSNFLNPSILQLQNCIVSRNGTVDASDTTIIPNIDQTDIASYWRNNVGLANTFVGGETRITTESVTTIAATSTFVDVAGTFTTNNLEHFDSPSAGQLRHLGDSPREFDIDVNFLIDGGSNDEIDLKIVVWDDSASSFVDYKTQRRAITNSIGGADVAYFYIKDKIYLDRNDYVKVQVANTTDTTNVTIKTDSEILISQK